MHLCIDMAGGLCVRFIKLIPENIVTFLINERITKDIIILSENQTTIRIQFMRINI